MCVCLSACVHMVCMFLCVWCVYVCVACVCVCLYMCTHGVCISVWCVCSYLCVLHVCVCVCVSLSLCMSLCGVCLYVILCMWHVYELLSHCRAVRPSQSQPGPKAYILGSQPLSPKCVEKASCQLSLVPTEQRLQTQPYANKT